MTLMMTTMLTMTTTTAAMDYRGDYDNANDGGCDKHDHDDDRNYHHHYTTAKINTYGNKKMRNNSN